ncbi:MAG: hypothetical protein PHY47_01315 [Lachnospiraceae bacterium]|nr:hypothetical protein [Lachnospiraceae bacterium]
MKLIFPKNKLEWNPKKLPGIPDRYGNHTGHRLVAAAQNGIDIYACFTDEKNSNIWIEKTTALNPLANNLCMEMLERISDDAEFNRIHQFFVKEGLLS